MQVSRPWVIPVKTLAVFIFSFFPSTHFIIVSFLSFEFWIFWKKKEMETKRKRAFCQSASSYSNLMWNIEVSSSYLLTALLRVPSPESIYWKKELSLPHQSLSISLQHQISDGECYQVNSNKIYVWQIISYPCCYFLKICLCLWIEEKKKKEKLPVKHGPYNSISHQAESGL